MTDIPTLTAINYHGAYSSQFPAIVRLTALEIITNKVAYFNVGQWLKSISLVDIHQLVEMFSLVDDENEINNPDYEDTVNALMILTLMLVQAEGGEFDKTEITKYMTFLLNVLGLETLARAGYVEVFYDNISFAADAMNNQIARKLKPVDL